MRFQMLMNYSAVAQLVERLPVKEDVPGSNPGRGARSSSAPMRMHWGFTDSFRARVRTDSRSTLAGASVANLVPRNSLIDESENFEGEIPGRGAETRRGV